MNTEVWWAVSPLAVHGPHLSETQAFNRRQPPGSIWRPHRGIVRDGLKRARRTAQTGGPKLAYGASMASGRIHLVAFVGDEPVTEFRVIVMDVDCGVVQVRVGFR